MEETPNLADFYYPKIESSGLSRDVAKATTCKTSIQEKLDGSQMSFCLRPDGITFFNRGREIVSPYDDVFVKAINMLKVLFVGRNILRDYVYHGEVIGKLRHNKIVYERTPRYYFVLFDIFDLSSGSWLEYPDVKLEGERLGLEVVQTFYHDIIPPEKGALSKLVKGIVEEMNTGVFKSMLGGIPEGVVAKNPRFGKFKQKPGCDPIYSESPMKIKCVRAQFKEAHKLKSKPIEQKEDANAIFLRIMNCFPSEPRWEKALQRFRDRGLAGNIPVENTTPYLVRDVRKDFKDECSDVIMEYLRHEMLPFFFEKATEGFDEFIRKNLAPQEPEN